MRINEGYLHSFIQSLTFTSHWGGRGEWIDFGNQYLALSLKENKFAPHLTFNTFAFKNHIMAMGSGA